jgi:hypothetical protein
MSGRETHVPILEFIYDTPNNQSILQCALDILLYADYSIYELHSEYPIYISPNKQKSIFTLKCYTVAQWLQGTEGLTLSPPPFTSLPTIQADVPDVHVNIDVNFSIDSPPDIPPDVPADNIINIDNDRYDIDNNINNANMHETYLIDYALNVIQNLEQYFHIQHHG